MAETRDNVVELKEVSVYSQTERVLHEVSASFPRGKSSVVLGPSGCGKSVLLKVCAGIIPPDSGEVYIEGQSLLRMSEKDQEAFRRRSGFVFQDAALWANKTVFDNLALPLQFHYRELSRQELGERIQRSLVKMGLGDSMFVRPAALSIGERKIVSFLRALVLRPSILFMDEPTLSVDHRVVAEMMKIIMGLRNEECSLITITHDPGLASMLADHAVVLEKGLVLAQGRFDAVRHDPNAEVQSILAQVLDQAPTYDGDLLELLADE